jgi:hypothetical protein
MQAAQICSFEQPLQKASFGESVDDIAIVLLRTECGWFQAC